MGDSREVRRTMKTDEYDSNKTPVMAWGKVSTAFCSQRIKESPLSTTVDMETQKLVNRKIH